MNLDTLAERYEEARSAYAEDRSDENYRAYKKAKDKFAKARTAQRQEEEADPGHNRGLSLAVVDDDVSNITTLEGNNQGVGEIGVDN